MNMIVGRTIMVVNPTPEVRKWCKHNLVLPNPEYTKKARMGFWVGNTPKSLSLYEEKGEDLELPFGLLKYLPNFFFTGPVEPAFRVQDTIDYGDPVPLYDYQQTAVDEMVKAGYGILQSPAGSGKTQMGIALIKRFGKRALWLTHTQDLLRQSKARAELYIEKKMIGTVTEGKVKIGEGVTFATVQTMCNIDLPAHRDDWDVIIIDECHRCAGGPTAVSQFYKVLNNLAARHKIGLSATVHRADGMIKATYALIGEVAYEVPKEAVGDKIMPVAIRPMYTHTQLSEECLNPDGTVSYAKLINHLCEDSERLRFIASIIVATGADQSCLILSDRIEHLENLMNSLPSEMKEDAVMVTGKMTTRKGKAEREKAIEDMRTGRKKYLFATYALAKEGLDIPRLNRLYLTTPQKDPAVVEQSVGRIARVFEGKTDPICYDIVDGCIPMLVKSFKARCTTYRKMGSKIE